MRETKILKLSSDDPERELDFELEFQASLTVQDLFDMMFQRSRDLRELLIKNGHIKPFEIIKRT